MTTWPRGSGTDLEVWHIGIRVKGYRELGFTLVEIDYSHKIHIYALAFTRVQLHNLYHLHLYIDLSQSCLLHPALFMFTSLMSSMSRCHWYHPQDCHLHYWSLTILHKRLTLSRWRPYSCPCPFHYPFTCHRPYSYPHSYPWLLRQHLRHGIPDYLYLPQTFLVDATTIPCPLDWWDWSRLLLYHTALDTGVTGLRWWW